MSQPKSLKIGLTGSIGSGKSTVAAVMEVLGVPVYYADAAAKLLMEKDPQLRSLLIAQFGENTFVSGLLNRDYLAREVFDNEEKLSLLNSLVHPVTISDAQDWMARQTAPYAIKEAALIFESGSNKYLDYIIGVQAPRDLRIKRVMERDSVSQRQVEKRMENQMDDNEKMRLCDYVIINDEQQMILPQVIAIHEELIRLSHAR
ncbi:MAG: dephospho-CoA kinase [Ginsengibacter sp.]